MNYIWEELSEPTFFWSKEVPLSPAQSLHCPKSKPLSQRPAAPHHLHLENATVIGKCRGQPSCWNHSGWNTDADAQKSISVEYEVEWNRKCIKSYATCMLCDLLSGGFPGVGMKTLLTNACPFPESFCLSLQGLNSPLVTLSFWLHELPHKHNYGLSNRFPWMSFPSK